MNSYVHGTSTTPLLGVTLGDCLDRMAEERQSGDAIVSLGQGIRLTYARLSEAAARIARSLLAAGIQPGDRVGLCGAGSAEWIIALHATVKVGAVLVTVNPAYRRNELHYALAHVGVSLLIVGRRFANNDPLARLIELLPQLAQSTPGAWHDESLPLLRTVVSLGSDVAAGTLSWRDFEALGDPVDDEEVHARQAAGSIDAAAMILYTSGTTGHPKGVVLSHHNVVNGGFFVGERLRYTSADRICLPLPLYHVLGCVAATVAALTHGSTIVLPSETFDARRCLEAIDQERCTSIYGVPTMFLAQLEHPECSRFRRDSLRTGVISGASCPPEVMRRVVEDFAVPEITVGYGMTEMAPILYTAIDDSLEKRVSTAGTVQPHVECKVVDPSSGRIVPRGVVGELCARGYCVMRGYWHDDAATSRVIDDAGWMHSGDLATMAEDGYVSIVGRIKDLVIRGGENVSPREIEDLLRQHPHVYDVQIVGVPDRQYGEEICAWVRLRDGALASADELRNFCRRHLAAHKIPRYILFAVDFPTTASGKVQKFRLRERALEQLGMTSSPAPAVPEAVLL